MAVGIINRFKIVEIEKMHGDEIFTTPGNRHRLSKPFVKCETIMQTRQ